MDTFARTPAIAALAVSADGRYLSYVSGVDDRHAIVVVDRHADNKPRAIYFTSKGDSMDVNGCRWASNDRLLCEMVGSLLYDNLGNPRTTAMTQGREDYVYGSTALLALGADGSDPVWLTEGHRIFDNEPTARVIDWLPQDPDHVMIEETYDPHRLLLGNAGTLETYPPDVLKIDVRTGKREVLIRKHPSIDRYFSNGQGQVLLGKAQSGAKITFYGRRSMQDGWTRLSRLDAFTGGAPVPIAMEPGTDQFYLLAPHAGHDAVWKRGLREDEAATLVYSHPHADLKQPLFNGAGGLIGFEYEGDQPGAHYVDARAASVIESATRLLPDLYHSIVDTTPDQRIYLLRSQSDIEAGKFSILDASRSPVSLQHLGNAYPELKETALGRMESIRYLARDRQEIPGYLTLPVGDARKNLPMVVLPHDGPLARDSWEFSFLRVFLASRGYAVLQVNYRGSSGYGWEWQSAAHRDWGGLPHDDVVDAARWAIEQKIADPERVCIAGVGVGGYLALLSAVRQGDLFQCAISIAGIGDLLDFKVDRRRVGDRYLMGEELGTASSELKVASPARHAAQAAMPILLIHGSVDWQVPLAQSKDMANALGRAGKPHELIVLQGADHQLRWKSHRVQLLQAVEKFLQQHLGR